MNIQTGYRFGLLMMLLVVIGCSNSHSQQNQTLLKASEFSARAKSLPDVRILDVRTSEEFAKGHIENAENINWNGSDFKSRVSAYDRSKPVLVYCLSGGRSASASSFLRKEGFKEVYELEGGLIKWRGEGLPEVFLNDQATKNITIDQYKALIKSDIPVLVDFYADWCRPCREMQPHLDRLASEHPEKVKVIRINADDNPALLKELRVDELPTLLLYKSGKLSQRHIGFIHLNGLLELIQ